MNRLTLYGFIMVFITIYSHVYAQNIEVIGSCNLPGKGWGVQVYGEYAYVACDSLGLQVINVSDPAEPISVASYDTPGIAVDIFISGDYAYLADFSSLQVIDISNPITPGLAGEYQANNIVGVCVNGDYAYIACGYYPPAVAILDVSDPHNPGFISGLSFLGGAFDVCYSEDHLYVLSNETEPYANFMRVIDISNPQYPYISGSVAIPGTIQIPQDLKIESDYVYIADRGNGVQVVSVFDSSFPVVVGSYTAVGDAIGIFINGDYAYVSEYYGVIQALNISDPTNPTFYVSANANGPVFGIYVVDEYIYAVDWDSLIVFRCSTSDIEETDNTCVSVYDLQNCPNPFNTLTTIRFSLQEPSNVTIQIYDILGREVELINSGGQQAGKHQIVWNAETQKSGVYFCRIQAGEYNEIKKMVLLK